MKNNQIVTRFAPSPTGLLHAGNYRSAVFAYLLAKQNDGKFILRIEDTDRQRSKKEYSDNIIESLDWLGLSYDEIYYQSDNVSRHRFYLEKLIREDKAYVSQEEATAGDDKERRAEVIRFRNPGQIISFQDRVRGLITVDTTDLGDFVIAKSLDEPLFHLAVVIDDFEAGVTEVIRGEDHISNTPRHILIQQAIGAPTPNYSHLPLVLAPDRSKLSKRRGALAITEYRDRGYLPEALFNYMALLGWNPGGEQEIFTKEDLIKAFNIDRVQKGGAIFDQVKLDWFNREYIKKQTSTEILSQLEKFTSPEIYASLAKQEKNLSRILTLITERVNNYQEAGELLKRGDFDFLFSGPTPSRELLKQGNYLADTIKILEDAPESIFASPEEVKSQLWDFATENGRAGVLWPMRVALTGLERSPDPFTVASLLGKEETIKRLKHAQDILS